MTKFLNISTDTTLGGVSPSDEIVSSQKALKAYIDAQSGGGLPSQTGNAGKFLTTDGTDAGWDTTITEPLTVNYTSGAQGPLRLRNRNGMFIVNINYQYNGGDVLLGVCNPNLSIWAYSAALGIKYGGSSPNRIFSIYPTGNSVDKKYLGESNSKWTIVYATKLNNGTDITIPTTGGTMLVADSTGATAGQVLTLDSNLAPVWAAPGGGSSYTAGDGIDITSNVISVSDLDCGTLS